MNNDEKITQNAIEYVKKNSKEIIKKFTNGNVSTSENKDASVSLFMAGSPGAGKTEISKALIRIIEKDVSIKSVEKIIRIDPDDIREILPGYNGKNSYLFQPACSIAVEKICDYALNKNLDFLLDGTFSNYEKSRQNITRSLKRNNLVIIYYIYQDPIIAWGFTQKREALEGRNIPKDSFIDQFFAAKENASKIKAEFKDKINLNLFERNTESDYSQIEFNIENIDNYIKIEYTKESLKKEI